MKKLVAQAGDEAYSLQCYFAANAIQNIYLNHKRRKDRDAGIKPTVSAAARPSHAEPTLKELLKLGGSGNAIPKSVTTASRRVSNVRASFVKSIRRGIGLVAATEVNTARSDLSSDEEDVITRDRVDVTGIQDRRTSKVTPALSPARRETNS